MKQGWSTPDPWALLYALYLYAEKIGNHYDFTLREMLSIGKEQKFDLPAVDPITIFALNPDNVKEQVEISIKYEGYIAKTYKEVEKMLKLESKEIPEDIDYEKVINLASEARQKLEKVRPKTIAQAMRISGVNPADISILSIYLRKEYNK